MWWVIGFFLLLVLFPISLKLINKNNILLNSDSLHLQYLFQISVLLPLVSSVYLMVWLGSEYPFRLDSTGFNSFLNIQKFPLGILALSPILGAFVVYIHRSIQTTKQIEVTEKKNKVDIYFSRRKFIIEQLENIQIPHYGEIYNANHLYDRFIVFNNYDDKSIERSFSIINSRINDIHTAFTCVEKYTYENIDHTSLPMDVKSKLTEIEKKVKFILRVCEIKNNEFKISKIVSSFINNYNENMSSKVIDNYNYKNELDELLEDIRDEILSLHKFVQKLFTIILLDKDISEFLPNLEKLVQLRSDNGT